MRQVLFAHIDEKGREFTIQGDLQALDSYLKEYVGLDPDDEEYGINHINKDEPWGDSKDRWTAEERAKDEEGLSAVLHYKYLEWYAIFEKIDRKKNGTFAKNRVHVIHRGGTFAHYWEDSYGWNAPEIRLKSIDDFTAVLSLENITVHY